MAFLTIWHGEVWIEKESSELVLITSNGFGLNAVDYGDCFIFIECPKEELHYTYEYIGGL